jgi:modulator of FtsH protease HflC
MNRLIWISTVLALIVLVIASTTFTVNQNEYAIVTRFGKPVNTIMEPGLNFQMPVPIHKVNRFDKRYQLHQGLLMESLTKDRMNIAIRCVVIWKISDPLNFFESVGTMTAANQKLDDLLVSRVTGALGDFEFGELVRVEGKIKIPELENRIKTELDDRLDAGKYGIEIKSVELDRLALPEANAYSVYQRMRKERNAIANKYRAKGEQEAAKIRAEADREYSDILSRAYEETQKIRGEGEAEAARIYSDAFSRDPEFYDFWRSMTSYQKILDEKTTIVLTDDSELLKYLD